MVKALQLPLSLSSSLCYFRGFVTPSSSTILRLRPIATTKTSAFNHRLCITRASSSSTYTQSKASTDQILLQFIHFLGNYIKFCWIWLGKYRWSRSIIRSDPIKFTTRECSITPISPTPWSTSVLFCLVNHIFMNVCTCMCVSVCICIMAWHEHTHANWGVSFGLLWMF